METQEETHLTKYYLVENVTLEKNCGNWNCLDSYDEVTFDNLEDARKEFEFRKEDLAGDWLTEKDCSSHPCKMETFGEAVELCFVNEDNEVENECIDYEEFTYDDYRSMCEEEDDDEDEDEDD